MTTIIPKRVTAKMDGDFVVFLIGMKINKPWKINKWLPVVRTMGRMLKELEQHPEAGCLGTLRGPGWFVQYWRSFEHLEAYARVEAYARDPKQQHWPVWTEFNRRVGDSRGDVGIWHETYKVRAGEYECVYSGMPPFGLGKAAVFADAVGPLESARGRMSSG